MRHTTIIGLPTHWPYPGRFYGVRLRDMPPRVVAYYLRRRLPEALRAGLMAVEGFRLMAHDERGGW